MAISAFTSENVGNGDSLVDSNGSALQNGTSVHRPSNWVPVAEQPIHTPRKLRLVCIGAGYAGLMMAHKIKYLMKMEDIVDLCIYEKNGDVGGTWLENRYPGVACDVPAHIYTFSFEPNPNWSSFYARGPEIWEYIRKTTTKYGLDEHVKFHSRVTDTIWDDKTGKWTITINQNGHILHDEADILVNASGILNKWRWPQIEGIESYKGKLLHSAKWDESYDWNGKNIAVIGNGSSAIQIVPQMQKTAKHIENYIRSSTWVTANFCPEHAKDGKNFFYSEEQKKAFRENPRALHQLRKEIEHSFNRFFFVFLQNSPEQEAVQAEFRRKMEERLNHDPELIAKLVPEWGVGCRRITPGEGYLEAIQSENATTNFSQIQRITETGIETVDGHKDFDAIVCATGFDVSFTPFWNMVGRNCHRLASEWKEDPEAYLGICAPNSPNYFMFNGPNCPIGHGSLLAVMEWTAEYILRWCQKIATEDIRSVCVKEDAVDEYNVYSQEFLKRTVWSGGCRSWYKNGRVTGKVTAMYAGSILHYKENLGHPRGEDFDILYRSKNRFRYMGNGLTQREMQDGDLSYYVQK